MWTNNKTVIPLFFLFLYWLLFNYLVLFAPLSFFSVADVEAISDVQYKASLADSPQALTQKNWQPITLPDDWYKNHQHVEQIWYRSEVMLEAQAGSIWAVYLPSVTHNAAVFINGVWVGQGGRFSDPVSRHHNQPLLFRFSSALLQQGANQIDIRVKTTFVEQGLLDQIYLAPVEKLTAAYSWKHFIRVDFIQWITMAMYFMAALLLTFWLARPQDSVYGIFSIQLFFWATHNLNLFVSEIPIPVTSWEAMILATLGWTIVTMIFFIHRYVGTGNRKVEKIILPVAVLGTGIFFLPDIASVLHIGYSMWDSFVMIAGCYAIYYLLHAYIKQKSLDAYLMLLVGVPMLLFGLHDILLINNFIDRRDGLIMQYGVIPSVLLFSWFLIRRFVQSINKAEHLADTLEQRVNEKQQALQEQYQQLNVLEKQRVLAEERERIMRDMHDGIGGQLVSVISLLRDYKEPVFVKAREKISHSLADLRFVIDSLDPLLSDLPTLLGMMRMRLLDQLDAANIDLEWAVTELPEINNLSPRSSLHIMRIVQEAITNSIKHSNATKMKLATGVVKTSEEQQNEQWQIYIDIIDYGKGVDMASVVGACQGRGLANMRFRAQQLGATLNINSSVNGTCVRLLLSC